MKKIIVLVFTNIMCISNLFAHLDQNVLIEHYGAIRSDMVRTACQIANFKNDSILKLISNESLSKFNNAIKGDSALYSVISLAAPLQGKNVAEYDKKIKETRRKFEYQLGELFPNQEIEISESFHKYLFIIKDLTDECNAFNSDSSDTFKAYSEKYPSGRFKDVAKDLIKKAKERERLEKRCQFKSKNHKSVFLNNIISFLLTLVKWFVGLVFLIILIVLLLWKRKSILSLFKKSYLRMNEGNITMKNQINDKALCPTDNSASAAENSTSNKSTSTIPNEPIASTTQTSPSSVSQTSQNTLDSKGKSMTLEADDWIIVGASVQGNGHIGMNLPCQDSHTYEYIKDGWGIAITSDGAGSAKLSHIGSAASATRAMFHFKTLIEKEKWIENNVLPSDNEWMKMAYQVLRTVRNELDALAKKMQCDIKDLSATIIVVIHSPLGALVTHIGDGRAGYKDNNGRWHSFITPHKGEEANQTIFIPSDFWNIPFYEMSDVMVPESKIIREPITAFTLMSDGCESTSWLCNQKNETTGMYYDPNIPHEKFFNSIIETLKSFREDNISLDERKNKWYNFLREGHKAFVKETDDKTMIIGTLYK